MNLARFASCYAAQRGLRPHSRLQLSGTIRVFGKFLRAEPGEEHLEAEWVNLFAEYLSRRRSARTVKHRVGALRTLAIAAGRDDAHKIRRVRVPEPVIRAPTVEEAGRLVAAAGQLRGVYPCGVERAAWWRAFLLVQWETGLRLSDMLALRWSDLRPNCTVVMTESKTGRVFTCTIRPGAWAALTAIRRPKRELLFPCRSRRTFFQQFAAIARKAGVPGATSKWMRRGGATQVWREHGPEAAARYLNHRDRTGGLAWRHYVDRSQLNGQRPLPPEIA